MDTVTDGTRRTTLGRRFTAYVLFALVAVLTMLSVIETAFSFSVEKQRLYEELDHIRFAHYPMIVTGLWLTDEYLVQNQVESIADTNQIFRVEVIDSEGNRFIAGDENFREGESRKETLTYSRGDFSFMVGSITIFLDDEGIRRAAFQRVLHSVVTYGVLIFTAVFLVAGLFRVLVGKPLESLAFDITTKSLEDPPVSLGRKRSYEDELDILVDSLNTMRSKLRDRIFQSDLLMREVQHRVKNDLNLVHAMLQFQASQTDSEQIQAALREANTRVFTVAQVYSRLYQGSRADSVTVEEFIGGLLTELKRGTVDQLVRIEFTVEPIVVPAGFAVTVGIVVNELVTNASKYAFTEAISGERERTIHVAISGGPGGRLIVTVSDNGRGFSADLLDGSGYGFGYTVLNALASSHAGTVVLRNSPGGGGVVEVTMTVDEQKL